MTQLSFADLDYLAKRKTTKKERFLAEMARVVPFARLQALIEPHYPKTGEKGGRPVKPLPMMLRVHLMQNWFGYSDPGMEEALYDIEALRRFAGLRLNDADIPDETTILNFRRLLETHRLGDALFAEINAYLTEKGLLLKRGTIVDATIVHAPPSTKNRERSRDAEMSSTKKNDQWHFGAKAHIGVDADSGAVHTVAASTAKVHDSQMLDALLHGEEEGVLGDGAYASQEKAAALAERGTTLITPIKAKPGRKLHALERQANRLVASPRAKVEHVFRVLKCQFGYRKVRFRGLAKNLAQWKSLFGLANLYLLRRKLMKPLPPAGGALCAQGA